MVEKEPAHLPHIQAKKNDFVVNFIVRVVAREIGSFDAISFLSLPSNTTPLPPLTLLRLII